MKSRKSPRKPQYYVMELGLDADVGPDTDGTYPLVRCLARWDRSTRSGTWVPAWTTEFQPGDWIVFRIFDYTAGAKKTTFDPKIFEIHFIDRHQFHQLRSPFSSTDPTANNPIVIDSKSFSGPDGARSAATGSRLGWICSDGGDQKISPFFPGELAYRFSKDKLQRFLFRILIEVVCATDQGTYELRIYDHDPEIFVGEGDPPPHRG